MYHKYRNRSPDYYLQLCATEELTASIIRLTLHPLGSWESCYILDVLYGSAKANNTLWTCQGLSLCSHCYNNDIDTAATIILDRTIATMSTDYIVTTLTLDHTAATMALDTIVAFVILLVSLLMSSPVMWRK
jgi:hypothetical protein